MGKDVFLSHSGMQKNFVRQLHRDLTNQGFSCFFDEDPESLPKGEDFPSRIFKAAKTCKIAVLVLSKDFLKAKWPMLELSAFVEARYIACTNPNLKIIPLLFRISPDVLKADSKIWKDLGQSGETLAKWHQALKKIRESNALKISGDDEVKFREVIVKEIWGKIKPWPRYHVPRMQGEDRMCKEIQNFFHQKVQRNEKGIRIAGLYGPAGRGKTTLGKAFCNSKLTKFQGKVCHLEFSRGDSFERIKIALRYLTHCSQLHLQELTNEDQAKVQLKRRVKGEMVLLVLDNITEESMDEVRYYVDEADMGQGSVILLSARSREVLKNLKIDKSCIHVPRLQEEEAVRILLERTSVEVSTLGAMDKAFAVKCANRCSFRDFGQGGEAFHPLALKAFGHYLFDKYGCHISKWVSKWVDGCGYGLDDLFAVLGTHFDSMSLHYRTIFMLLTLYMPRNISPHKVPEWLAWILNKEILFIEKAVKDLCKKAFIEESRPRIRIHDLYIELAQSKANEMGRWLWWKGDPCSRRLLSSEHKGFELAKLEQCMNPKPSRINTDIFKNLLVLQLVGVQDMSKLRLDGMDRLRSITLHKCLDLAALEGMEKLQQLAWFQISEVNPMFKLPQLSSLGSLRHLEINIPVSEEPNQLGDLTRCRHLREINVRCQSLSEFPRLSDLRSLENVQFIGCDRVKEPLDCRGCVKLQSIAISGCCQMTASPLLAGCKKLSQIKLWECHAVKKCPDIDVPSVSSTAASATKKNCNRLEIQLWSMGKLVKLPSFRRLSNLTVLTLGKNGITTPPDLRYCVMLENVSFFTLKNLEKFPDFSLLGKLKKLRLHDCARVQNPPHINGCHKLKVFHLVYNDNMRGLPKMDDCPVLEEIELSWHSDDKVTGKATDIMEPCEVKLSDRSVPEKLKEWDRFKNKRTVVKQFFRGEKHYYLYSSQKQRSCD